MQSEIEKSKNKKKRSKKRRGNVQSILPEKFMHVCADGGEYCIARVILSRVQYVLVNVPGWSC